MRIAALVTVEAEGTREAELLVSLDDERVDLGVLRARLEQYGRDWEMLHPGVSMSPPVVLEVAYDIRLERLRAVFSEIPPGFELFLMVSEPEFVSPVALPLPEASADIKALASAVASRPRNAFRTELQREYEKLARHCPGMLDVSIGPNWSQSIRELSEIVSDCGCERVNMDSLETWMLLMLVATPPGMGLVPLNPAEMLRQREGATTVQQWVDLVTGVEARVEPFADVD